MDHPAVMVDHQRTSGIAGADGFGSFGSGQRAEHVVVNLDVHQVVLLVAGRVLQDFQLNLKSRSNVQSNINTIIKVYIRFTLNQI